MFRTYDFVVSDREVFALIFLCCQISAITSHMHDPGKVCFQLLLPYRCSFPSWLKLTSDKLKEQIYKLAKKRPDSLPNRVIPRKSHGVSQDCFVTSNEIPRILKSKGISMTISSTWFKKWSLSASILRGREDDSKFHLILIESRIPWLTYYIKT